MGQSTNAILFYGYCFTEETSKPWHVDKDYEEIGTDDEDDDWEDRYGRLRQVPEPSQPYPSRQVKPTKENGYSSTPKDYSAEEQAIIEEHRTHWAAVRALVKAEPCEVGTHCSGDCPMPYVAIKSSVKLAHRGDPVEIDSIDVDGSWNAQLLDFCALMGIDVRDARVGWWLVSNWN